MKVEAPFAVTMKHEHHVDWDHSQAEWYDRLKLKLGPIGERIKFIVQEPIESVCEVGIDTYFLDSGWQELMLGWEIKDAGYVGRAMTFPPDKCLYTLNAVSEYLESSDYNSFFSNEMRITKDGTVYMTDATCRVPSPPGGVMMWAAKNFPDVVPQGREPLTTATPNGSAKSCSNPPTSGMTSSTASISPKKA